MRLTFRYKLLVIVGTAALGFSISIVAQAIIASRMNQQIASIRQRFIPIIELGPRLSNDFEHLRRSLQDAVAAQDHDALASTRALRDKLLEEVAHGKSLMSADQASSLRASIADYYASAYSVSQRLLSRETGVRLVHAMSDMQSKQARVEKLLKETLTLDHGQLEQEFFAIEKSQRSGGRARILISATCLIVTIFLCLVISRGVLHSLEDLSQGLRRFGRGEFNQPIVIASHDELEDLAHQANQMADQIQRLMKELESFSYSVAHDLRAPLRSMVGFSSFVLEDHGKILPEDAKATLSRVIASAKKMGQLVDSLLSLSRLARAEIKREPVNLSQMAESILEELRANQPERKVETVIEKNLVVRGDSALLHAVLTNLLNNAWKFTSKKTSARIEFGSEYQERGEVFFVQDNGAGFDMQYAAKLFGTFQRLHSEQEFEGTGVGLATVQRVIQRHGGEIWAKGKPGEGAMFSFTLGKG